MTLRVRFEIIPYEVESDAYELGHIDISNIRKIEDLGFGHSVCEYSYKVLNPIPPILITDGVKYDIRYEGVIKEHDRRDGFLSLTQKVLNDIGVQDEA